MASIAMEIAAPMHKHKKEKPYSHPDRHWEVRDAMRTIMRAGEILRNEKLMAEVKKHAKVHAAEMKDMAHQAEQLARTGRISPKQMAKMGMRKSDAA